MIWVYGERADCRKYKFLALKFHFVHENYCVFPMHAIFSVVYLYRRYLVFVCGAPYYGLIRIFLRKYVETEVNKKICIISFFVCWTFIQNHQQKTNNKKAHQKVIHIYNAFYYVYEKEKEKQKTYLKHPQKVHIKNWRPLIACINYLFLICMLKQQQKITVTNTFLCQYLNTYAVSVCVCLFDSPAKTKHKLKHLNLC